jgi:hypothetical protein
MRQRCIGLSRVFLPDLSNPTGNMVPMFSDYIVYVDESGDHGLTSVQEPYPIFVLSFCIFKKDEYRSVVVPEFLNLKFNFFGHDCVILHSHEIRKAYGPFKVLVNAPVRLQFLEALDLALQVAPFNLVAAIIDKKRLCQAYSAPVNPYEIALRSCLERTFSFLLDQKQDSLRTSVIVECRGAAEDTALELAFRRIVQGDNRWGTLPFDIIFADKKANSVGLQIADLVSHPIGRHYLSPVQMNRAYQTVEPKLGRSPDGETDGWGLKVFP